MPSSFYVLLAAIYGFTMLCTTANDKYPFKGYVQAKVVREVIPVKTKAEPATYRESMYAAVDREEKKTLAPINLDAVMHNSPTTIHETGEGAAKKIIDAFYPEGF